MKYLETSPLASLGCISLRAKFLCVLTVSLLAGQSPLLAASPLERILPANAEEPIILQARPDQGVVAWAVEEQLPSTVTPLEISHGGSYDPYTNKVKWGPYTDVLARDLSYRISIPGLGEVTLAGAASWDGATPVPTTGETILLIAGDGGFTDWLIATFGNNVLGTPQADPQYDGDDDGNPLLAEYYFGLDPAVADSISFTLEIEPGSLGLTLVRRQAASQLPTILWFSSNLADWTTLEANPPLQLSVDGDRETIQYDFGDLGQPAFIRLQMGD
ncbi:MAG: hypothetical protein AB3N33_07920 [Puniceicoccaceae bacterium]